MVEVFVMEMINFFSQINKFELLSHQICPYKNGQKKLTGPYPQEEEKGEPKKPHMTPDKLEGPIDDNSMTTSLKRSNYKYCIYDMVYFIANGSTGTLPPPV